jgi:hypothetical protein
MKRGIDYEQRPETKLVPGLFFLFMVFAVASIAWLAVGVNPLQALAQLVAKALGFCC